MKKQLSREQGENRGTMENGVEIKLLSLLVGENGAAVATKCLEAGIKSVIFEKQENALFYRTILIYFNKFKQIPNQSTYIDFLNLINFKELTDEYKARLPIVYSEVLEEKAEEPLDFILDHLLKYYKTRRIKNVLLNSIEGLKPSSIEDTAAFITSEVSKAKNYGLAEGTEGDFRNCGRSAMERYDQAVQHGFSGLKYGFPSLDLRTGGHGAGELWIVLGYMKVGKSSMLLNMANNVWKSGKGVVYFSAEVSKTVLERRLTAMNLELPITGIKQGTLLDSERAKMSSFYQDITKAPAPFYIVDRGAMTTDYIASKVHELKNIMPIDLVVVDYLGICRTNSVKSNAKDYEVVAALSWDLRDIAKLENVPVLTAHQANREKGISRGIGVGQNADFLFSIEVKDENQILAGSESVDLEAKIMLARDSAAGQFNLEAYYSKGLIIEPTRAYTPVVDNSTGDNDEDF